MTISLLDQMRAFDQKFPVFNQHSPIVHKDSTSSSPKNTCSANLSSLKETKSSIGSIDSSPSKTSSLLNSYGIVHDEWTETSYLGMNVLINVISSQDIEICAQACAKINTILYNKQIQNVEEACYLIASVEKVMYERVNESKTLFFLTFLFPNFLRN